jgi:hypothetical protein
MTASDTSTPDKKYRPFKVRLSKKRAPRDTPIAYNFLVGLMYTCIAITFALAIALIFQVYLAGLPSAPTGQEQLIVSEITTRQVTTAEFIFAATLTGIVVIASAVIFVALPLLIGSSANAIIQYILALCKKEESWKARFIIKSVLLLASFLTLSITVVTINLAVGYALLISGAISTLFALLLLIIQLLIRPGAHKNPAKAW